MAVLLFTTLAGSAQSPLRLFGDVWNNASYKACNTASSAQWLAAEEKDVIYILNLLRTQPKQFLQTVVKQWPKHTGRTDLLTNSYYRSLLADLEKQAPLGMIRPDSLTWVSARCHAQSSGKTGYVGHERQTASCRQLQSYMAECCNYGYSRAIDIVMSLLIDENVPSLGHRKILLMPFDKAGVSIQPHKEYGYNTVLDFR